MPEDLGKYKDAFLTEAKELLHTMNASLLEFEKSPQNMECVGVIFRAAHTLKGMSDTMGYVETTGLCHALENVLHGIRNRDLSPDKCIDILFECFDTLETTLKLLEKNKEELATAGLVRRLGSLSKGFIPPGQESNEDTTDEVVLGPEREAVVKVKSVDVRVERLDALMNLAEEFLIIKMRLDGLKPELIHPEFNASVDTLGRLVKDMQYNVMQARMVPVGFIFNRFPRMVRDLAKKQGKEVEIKMTGGDLELDRAVIDHIGESLVHLLRNAVDHGIESPAERREAGKAPQAVIELTAKGTKDFAVIEVRDDGRGLDIDAIKTEGIRRGLLTPESGRDEILQSIYTGVSTTKEVTEVSGRGLGMDIVRKRIESLGGAIRLETEPGKGTTFILEIPLTLAVIKTLFVRVGAKVYAIPLAVIDRLVTVRRSDIKGFLNYEAIVLDEEDIPITRLGALFDLAPSSPERQPIVIVRKGRERMGLAIDALLATQEIVIKPLHRFIRENRYFAGSAIMGSGEVVLVLDVSNIILSKRNIVKAQQNQREEV
jgi:two-component system, chemotaxis family, sensor kinase CheA